MDSITKTSPYLKGMVTPIPEANDQLETDEFKALIDTCKDLTSKFIDTYNQNGEFEAAHCRKANCQRRLDVEKPLVP